MEAGLGVSGHGGPFDTARTFPKVKQNKLIRIRFRAADLLCGCVVRSCNANGITVSARLATKQISSLKNLLTPRRGNLLILKAEKADWLAPINEDNEEKWQINRREADSY